MNIDFDTNLVIAKPLDSGGFTWTLASRLGHMIETAENLYGSRDKTYTILGVELCSTGPQIWYPGDCKSIVVQLSDICATDVSRACYQMSHETIHLLSPIGTGESNVLEEGLATYFSIKYCSEIMNAHWQEADEKYRMARLLVTQLLEIDANIILKTRLKQPIISRITVQDIIDANGSIPLDLATNLVRRF